MTKPLISIVVACDKNRVIGKENKLPWKIPADLQRFKRLTTGHPVIMGRKTWESIPEKFRPLPGRTNIVVTRNESYSAQGAIISNSVKNALELARTSPGQEEIFFIGGAQIYTEAKPLADRLYVTEVDTEIEGDAFFPEYKSLFIKKILEEPSEHEGLKYSYLILEK